MLNIGHYGWLTANLATFLNNINLSQFSAYTDSIIACDGDKCYGYQSRWEQNNIPFHHGVALYLLTKIPPYSKQVRETPTGWVDPAEWVIVMYPTFKKHLPD